MKSKLSAIAFALLLTLPSVPAVLATHTQAPDIPGLPHAKPEDECLGIGISSRVLVEVQKALNGQTPFATDPQGVPAVCGPTGEVSQVAGVVLEGDRQLEILRNLTFEIQRQLDQRVEATLPEGELTDALLHSRTTLLDEDFDGATRAPGFGPWTVVTSRGEAPAFYKQTQDTPNGTQTQWRFGDDQGYARGAHQWLVSPEIDLTVLKGDPVVTQKIAAARVQARNALFGACNNLPPLFLGGPNRFPQDYCGKDAQTLNANVLGGGFGGFVGLGVPLGGAPIVGDARLNAVVTAYEAAFDDVIRQMPAVQHAAYVDITYRSNFYTGTDGVRVWAVTGDRAPTRVELSDLRFGDAGIEDSGTTTREDCVSDTGTRTADDSTPLSQDSTGLVNASPAGPRICETRTFGARPITPIHVEDGAVVGDPGWNMTELEVFESGVARPDESWAITGDSTRHETKRLNLTEFQGQRLWLVFEVKTQRNDRGLDIFTRENFPRGAPYGFELQRVFAEGEGYLRNVRVKDVGSNLPLSSTNRSVLITVPPGDHVDVRLHNAGRYRENLTLTVEFATADNLTGAAGSIFSTFTQKHTMRPDEVLVVPVPWPQPVVDKGAYNVTARIAVDAVTGNLSQPVNLTVDPDQTGRGRLPPATEPNATIVRPANAPDVRELRAGSTTASAFTRGDLARELTATHVPITTTGPTFEVCSAVDETSRCTPLFIAKKGEPRILLTGVRNDGAAPEDVQADLVLSLDGVDRSTAILDGARREVKDLLPGETRALTWTISPAEAGIWRAQVFFVHEDGTTEAGIERFVYVGRSPGLLCLDDLLDRECGASVVGSLDEELARIEAPLASANVTAAHLAQDGTLTVATQVVDGSGVLAQRTPDGVWTKLLSLTPEAVNRTTGAPREGYAVGSIAAIVAGEDGTLYLAGANHTLLALAPNGNVTMVRTEPVADATYAYLPPAPFDFLPERAFTAPETVSIPVSAAQNATWDRLYVNVSVASPPAAGGEPRVVLTAPNGTVMADVDVDDESVELVLPNHEGTWSLVVEDAGQADSIFASMTGVDTTPAQVALSYPVQHFTDAVALDGRAFFTSTDGGVWRLTGSAFNNTTWEPVASPAIARENVTALDADRARVNYTGDLTAIAVGHAGSLVVGGTGGYLGQRLASGAWAPALGPDPTAPLTWSFDENDLNTTTIRDIVAHDGATYAIGRGHILVKTSASPSGAWKNVTLPPSATGNDERLAVSTHLGTLMVVESSGQIALCDPCGAAPAWTAPAVPLPLVDTTEPSHAAAISALVSGEAATYLLGEAGMLLEYAQRGFYPNEGDWQTISPLAPRDGGVVQTRPWSQSKTPPGADRDGIWRGYADTTSPTGDVGTQTSFTQFRVRLTHAIDVVPPAGDAGAVYLLWAQFPGSNLQGLGNTCGSDPAVAGAEDVGFQTGCSLVRTKALNFSQPTPGYGWTVSESQPIPPKGNVFFGADLVALKDSRWGVDDVVVEARTREDAPWVPVLAWYGLNSPLNVGAWRNQHLGQFYSTTVDDKNTAGVGSTLSGVGQNNPIWEIRTDTFDREIISPWHITSQFADRPVWALNDELFQDGALGVPGPRLRTNWDTRLISPTIDLTNAIDPVVSFRHAFAFRVQIGTSNGEPYASPGDGGLIEVQYQRLGRDRDPSLGDERCTLEIPDDAPCGWSRFYVVNPDNRTRPGDDDDGNGYPTLAEVGMHGWRFQASPNSQGDGVAEAHRIGPADDIEGATISNQNAQVLTALGWDFPSRSYWARSALPDERGVISSVRDTSTYEEVTVTLSKKVCQGESQVPGEDDCLPRVDIQNRPIRVAFHALTAGKNARPAEVSVDGTYPGNTENPSIVWNVTRANGETSISFPGEGWYITDFKVRGNPQLGVDLQTSALALRTGYDALALGVGPGTRVPVNVTVENRGRFEVGSYAGELEVRRVIDAATQRSEVIDRVKLEARPALAPEAKRNETVNWTVPGPVAELSRTADASTAIAEAVPFALAAGVDRPERTFEVRFFAQGQGVVRFGLARGDDLNAVLEGFEVDGSGDTTRIVKLAGPAHAGDDGLARYALRVDTGGFKGIVLARVTPIDEYLLTMRIAPLGSAADEDPTDNVLRIGTFLRPLAASPKPGLKVEFLVSPENATADITRYVPMFLNNTGNVPLDCVEVTRTITLLQGELSTFETDTWRTDRPVPPGQRVALAALSAELDPASDLFWRAAKSAPYVFDLSASTCGATPALTASAPTKPIAAFSTYLFADVDGGVRGEAVRDPKAFALGDEWAEGASGFRSQRSYAFGNLTSGRYAPDTDGSATTPVIDISGARTARLAFYHRYAFEAGYDGGVIEASADGGRTWERLQPSPDKLNDLPEGYNSTTPLSAGSILHEDHDPNTRTLAFTADSSVLPASVDGWVLSEIDLTDFSAITETDIPYESYTSAELQDFAATPAFPDVEKGAHVYVDKSWIVGREQEKRYWEVDNETDRVAAQTTDANRSFWWSGSIAIEDDGVRPLRNQLLTIPVDLREVQPGESVRAEWWEWVDRFGGGLYEAKPDERNVAAGDKIAPVTNLSTPTQDRFFLGAVSYQSLVWPGQAYRLNVPRPDVLETRGRWYHMSADLTPYLSMDPAKFNASASVIDVGFAYAPLSGATAEPVMNTANHDTQEELGAEMNRTDTTDVNSQTIYDRGFAIDGFRVIAQRAERGVVETRVILDEDDAWAQRRVERCDPSVNSRLAGGWRGSEPLKLPCYYGTPMADSTLNAPMREMLSRPGYSWNLVDELPGIPAPWSVVTVRDAEGTLPTDRLGNGARPSAWYSGYIPNVAVDGADCDSLDPVKDPYPCVLPGSESRLVTPAVNLTRVAGESVDLTFTHRYAFSQFALTGTHPFSAGGAVEVSRYDPATKTWLPWEQLYSAPPTLRQQDWIRGRPLHTVDGEENLTRGGYSGYTVNVTGGSTGLVYDAPPFQAVKVADPSNTQPCEPGVPGRERGCIEAQFLYTGSSTRVDNDGENVTDGWVDARFDISAYRGQLVRFAFHMYVPQWKAHNVTLGVDLDNDRNTGIDGFELGPDGRTGSHPLSGWWIGDVQVVGKVLEGKPVQLRFRAGTDGDIDDGHWLVDDIGVFGSPYRNNLGIFTAPPAEGFGVVAGGTETIPVTIRNLGETVRRDLALEIRQSKKLAVLEIAATGGTKPVVVDPDFLLVPGITLAPGQSAVVNITLKAPVAVGADGKKEILLALREFNPVSGGYVQVVDNEVQGFLRREIDLRVTRQGILDIVGQHVTPAVALPGQPLDLVLTLRNGGYKTIGTELNCTALTVDRYTPTDHHTPVLDRPVPLATYDCVRQSGPTTIARGQWANVTFRVTPTVAGTAILTVKGRVLDGINDAAIEDIQATVAVGASPVLFDREFGQNANDVQSNWTFRAGTPQWERLRGNREPGSMVLGFTDAQRSGSNADYTNACASSGRAGYCRVFSPAIDLHNHSAQQELFLSFWHLDRFARWDGGIVTAQILLDEAAPTQPQSWSNDCVLVPIDRSGLGVIRQIRPTGTPPQTTPGDLNPVFGTLWDPTDSMTDPIFFTSPQGWEDEWSLARYDLTASCQPLAPSGRLRFENDEAALDDETYTLAGHTVRFVFHSFFGPSSSGVQDPDFPRGHGHGWYIDDISVSPVALSISPASGQRAQLLDNSTKPFSVVLQNHGSITDRVVLSLNESRSSAPAGSIRPPTGVIELKPGERRIVSIEAQLPRDPSLLPTEFRAPIDARSLVDKNSVGSTRLDLLFAPRQWAELLVSVEAPRGVVQEGTVTVIPVTVENNGIVDSVPTTLRIVDTWAGGQEVTTRDLSSMPSFFEDADGASRVVDFRWSPPKGSSGKHTLTFLVDPDGLGEEYTRTNNEVSIVVEVSELLVPDLSIANESALVLRNALGGVVSPSKEADVTRYEVTAGELMGFELHVRNLGRSAATNVDVRASIGSLNLPSRQVPYIAPGGVAVVPFNWVAQKGEHQIQFLVRADQLEASSANNRQPATGVTILTVKGFEVTVEVPALEGLLEAGTQVKVPFKVTNAGNAGEDLVLRSRAPEGTRLQLPREGFFLRAGESYDGVAVLTLSAESVAGEQVMSIEASARENPLKTASGRVPAVVKASYGGSIASADILGAPPAMTLAVDLVNEGNSLEPWSVNLRLPAGWVAAQPLPAKVSVPAHGTARLLVDVTMPASTAPGDRAVGVVATLPDGSRRDADLRVQVLPLRAAALSLAVGGEAAKTANGAIELPVTVQNTGNVKAPFQVVLVDVPTGVALKVEPASFELAPGAKVAAKLVVKPSQQVESGRYPVLGYTLFQGVNPDTAEGRANIQALDVPIVRQDLRLAGAVEYAPRADLKAGDLVAVKVPVVNRGQALVENVTVHLFVDDVFVGETVVPSIAAGARSDVTLNWTAVLGTHTLTAVIDPYNDTVDADRADNAGSALAVVGAGAASGALGAARQKVPAFEVASLALALALALALGWGRRKTR